MKSILKKVFPLSLRRIARDALQMAIYSTPNPIGKVRLSERAQTWYEILMRDGIVRTDDEPSFIRIADYLESEYFSNIEKSPEEFITSQNVQFPFGDKTKFVWDINTPLYRSGGTEILCYTSFSDPQCKTLYLNEDIAQVIYKYYGRQPYYRNQPVIQKISLHTDQAPLTNGSFHVDHLRQISLMLLVTDISENETHMQYCVGSNRRDLLREGIELPVAQCEAKAQNYPIFKCTGKKGTLFIFDTSGFHRANYISNSTRKMLHLNITTGHNLVPFIDKGSESIAPNGTPDYVKRMFRFLNAA